MSQINSTLTNVADHGAQVSHDAIPRYLRHARLTPRLVWENVIHDLVATATGYIVLDDTLLDKTARSPLNSSVGNSAATPAR